MSSFWHPAPKKKPARPACIGCVNYQSMAITEAGVIADDGTVFHGLGTCDVLARIVAANSRHPCALYEFYALGRVKPKVVA